MQPLIGAQSVTESRIEALRHSHRLSLLEDVSMIIPVGLDSAGDEVLALSRGKP